MCTIGRTTVKAAGEAHHRPDAEECTVRREQGRTDCGSKRGRNSFLSTPLTPIAPSYRWHRIILPWIVTTAANATV